MRRIWPPRSSTRHNMMHVVGAYVARLLKWRHHEVNKMVLFSCPEIALPVVSLVPRKRTRRYRHRQSCSNIRAHPAERSDVPQNSGTRMLRRPKTCLHHQLRCRPPRPGRPQNCTEWAEVHHSPSMLPSASGRKSLRRSGHGAQREPMPKESCGRHQDAPGRAQEAPTGPE